MRRDLQIVLIVWLLGLIAIAAGAASIGWPCPFEMLSGLPCPLCDASTAIARLLAGDLSAALHMHPTATVAALASAAMGAGLFFVAQAAPVTDRVSASGVYLMARKRVIYLLLAMLILQWCTTLFTYSAVH